MAKRCKAVLFGAAVCCLLVSACTGSDFERNLAPEREIEATEATMRIDKGELRALYLTKKELIGFILEDQRPLHVSVVGNASDKTSLLQIAEDRRIPIYDLQRK